MAASVIVKQDEYGRRERARMTMRNLKLIVAYDGTGYSGWQVQPNRKTIQGVLEDRLGRMLGETVRLAGAGRTDAGVHARGQVANFHTACRIPIDGLRQGLNARLPRQIRVLRVDEVDEVFHSRMDAVSKEYSYSILVGDVLSPFDAPFVTASCETYPRTLHFHLKTSARQHQSSPKRILVEQCRGSGTFPMGDTIHQLLGHNLACHLE